jgi:hypothetical protein
MDKKFWVLSMVGAFFLAAGTARAQSVDDKIKALEQELTNLKQQQVELKKEATAAAAALPTFEYRPGNGLDIQAADKSWGLRFTIETYFRAEFEHGLDQQGRVKGEIMGRRFRPGFFYCINNCLWEIEASLDMDGFGTGNAKNSTATDLSSILQRGAVHFHAEQLHPWLPTVDFGMDVSTTFGSSLSRQGSSSTGAQAEYDITSRNNGFNTGRAGQGVVLNWDDRSLSGIGIPGRIGRFQVAMASIGQSDDGLASFTDKKSFALYGNIQPFSQLKNKWIRGLTFEAGTWFCNIDNRDANGNGCQNFQIRDNGDSARQVLINSGSMGDGLVVAPAVGIRYEVGPNTIRFAGTWEGGHDGGTPGLQGVSTNTRGNKRSRGWLIGDDLFLWSPKGFLTGSATTPGSILVGTHFERSQINVGCSNNPTPGTILCSQTGIGGSITQFHRNTVLLREWDLWYFLAPRMSVGVNVMWWNADNLDNRVGQAGYNLGLCSKTSATTTNCRAGAGGDWVDTFVNWRYTF